jgi:hypothetical protein
VYGETSYSNQIEVFIGKLLYLSISGLYNLSLFCTHFNSVSMLLKSTSSFHSGFLKIAKLSLISLVIIRDKIFLHLFDI